MAVDKEFYNEASASKLGWAPDWFLDNHNEFDSRLTSAIRKYQKNHGLTADGMCGPTTFRRINTQRESVLNKKVYENKSSSEVLWYRNQPIPIKWDKVVTFKEDDCFKLTGGRKRYGSRKRNVKYFVTHWDVCLSAESCVKVLNKRNLSIHFCIDNDGTIYQLMDLNDVAYHAGSSHNSNSVGVEISNAYYPKYQNWYKRHGFGERDLITDGVCHGRKMKPFMDFYPVQKEALKALYLACHEGLGIPLNSPNVKWGEDPECKSKKFRGFCSHYHLTRRKIDCAGLDIEEILSGLK